MAHKTIFKSIGYTSICSFETYTNTGIEMNANVRQIRRIEILKVLCDKLNYNINEYIVTYQSVKDLFNDIDNDELYSHLSFLKQKNYLSFNEQYADDQPQPMIFRLTVASIELIEALETNMETKKYEEDFSPEVLHNFHNITNSTIIIDSQNMNIYITNTENDELVCYFESLLKEKEINSQTKDLVSNVLANIKSEKPSKEYLKGIGQGLLSIGGAVISNVITPTIAKLLGIPMQY
jgi:hypothetical protein